MLMNKGMLSPSRYVSAKESRPRFSTSLVMPLQADKYKNDFNEVVLSAMVRLYPTVMRPPGSSIPWEIHSNPKMFPFFKGSVGALDGMHVPVIPPPSGAKPFRNQKGYMSQNILAACTFDLKFTYVLAGWEGSASDGRVLEDALLNKGFVIPPGKMYLGNQKTQSPKELYNLRHAQQRNCIERIFGVLKKRFRILVTAPEYLFPSQVNLVYALCAMHNIIDGLESDRHYLNKAERERYLGVEGKIPPSPWLHPKATPDALIERVLSSENVGQSILAVEILGAKVGVSNEPSRNISKHDHYTIVHRPQTAPSMTLPSLCMHAPSTFVASSLVPSTRREVQAPTSAPMNVKQCTKHCLAFHRKAYYPGSTIHCSCCCPIRLPRANCVANLVARTAVHPRGTHVCGCRFENSR
ncbi:hypothetical protein H257_09907 [Aphanomyces astaci]|uniref:DDE Tnp4 domain-containing protein n=1 Tax=Aphanomyces astaci TaxID=112090 RepID=W4GAG6_APHAT|nr:hypothetical protein H257_09907 [Aphanomyces astaci]ETV75948.1 hypothetical protein H257_09907 [Aphanomyces astaci]|eukprot:XP_009834590.1 hypothetical protein H257_09907 [Aphanomyces astaci]